MKKAVKPVAAVDAVALLVADHQFLKGLFKQFETSKKADDDDDKQSLVTRICNELKVHAQIEEELFYPAVQKVIGDKTMMDEAYVEHALAKDLVAQIEGMTPSDDLYDAKVMVLGELIGHHVKEEEDEMFAKAKKAKLDLAALGTRMFDRKSMLMDEISADEATGGRLTSRHVKPPRGTAVLPTSNCK